MDGIVDLPRNLVHDALFEQGYAIMAYSIAWDQDIFRYKDETFMLRPGSVPTFHQPGSDLIIAKVIDVLKAHNEPR